MYDFDQIVDRRNTNCYKWDLYPNKLPMWVADMDFVVCPEIYDALNDRLDKKVFGYNMIPDDWYMAYISWWSRRHHFNIKKESLLFSTGVVPTISSCVRALTKRGDKVLIQTPVYNIFFNSIINNGREVLESPLVYQNGEYHIDFIDLENKLSQKDVTMMILCNPHNPIGKIWDKETLCKIGELCYKHHVIVISDEIHCDITKPGHKYIPFGSVNDTCLNNSVICLAPTKVFNIAGLQTSAIVVNNPELYKKVYRAINNDEIAEPNSFAIQAAVAAFNKGEQWANEMCEYVFTNREIAKEFINKELPTLHLVNGEATYLLWVDVSKICDDATKLTDYLEEKADLVVASGNKYGHSGEHFIRINVACPKALLMDGLNRLKNGVNNFIKDK